MNVYIWQDTGFSLSIEPLTGSGNVSPIQLSAPSSNSTPKAKETRSSRKGIVDHEYAESSTRKIIHLATFCI